LEPADDDDLFALRFAPADGVDFLETGNGLGHQIRSFF
jgi:hypothetical protein